MSVRGAVVLALVACACNGTTPNGPCTPQTFHADRDGDGQGDPASAIEACEAPSGFVANADDCNDDCSTCDGDAVEVCDGVIDDNCNGSLDEGCACVDGSEQTCPGGSNVGSCRRGTQACSGGVWQVCEGRVEPTAELCNGADDDCDGEIDGPPATDACGTVAHASGVACSAGQCVLSGCATGFDDCNATFADGCEADLGVSATCGGCNTKCTGDLVCELGSCEALPRLEWTNDVDGSGIVERLLVRVRDDGDVVVAGSSFQAPVAIGALSVPGSSSHDLFLSALDAIGVPRWLIKDGTDVGIEQPFALRLSSDGTIFLVGTFANDAELAGDALVGTDADFQGSFLVSYSETGTGRWARPTSTVASAPREHLTGLLGIDTVTVQAAGASLKRFDAAGDLLFDRPFPFRDPMELLDQDSNGSLLLSASVRANEAVGPDCQPMAVPGTPLRVELVAIDVMGQCQELHENTLGVYRMRQPAGYFIVSVTPVGDHFESSLIALDAQFNTEWSVTLDGLQLGVETDDRGNVYWAVDSGGALVLHSYRPDGVDRWSTAIAPLNVFSFAVSNDGEIAVGIRCGAPSLQIGSSIVPCNQTHLILKLAGR